MIKPWYIMICVVLMMAAACSDDPPAEKVYIDGSITYQAGTTADTLQISYWDPSEATGPTGMETYGAVVHTTIYPGESLDHTISEYLVQGDIMYISASYIPYGDTLFLRIFGTAGGKGYDTLHAYFSSQGGRLEITLE